MKPILTAEEYRRVDKAYTGDLDLAMDKAGHAVALAAVRHGARYGSRVVVLVGPGNNGGDGYVAARYLTRRGVDVVIHRLAEPKTPEASRAARRAAANGVPVRSLGELTSADLVIDALFGGGGRRGLPKEILAWMDVDIPVIAVDFPTGLDPDTGHIEEQAFRAVETVTFSTLKTGHVRGDGPDHCGRVIVADIGISGGEPSMFLAEEADAPRPSRARTAHKWSAGSVLVVGGSPGIVGAAVYAGHSALTFGAGSVAVASPEPDAVTQIAPELPTFTLGEAESRLDRFDVVIAGPGLAETEAAAVLPVLRKAPRVVLDAGGLMPHLLDAALEAEGEVVITPHVGEFPRVAGVGAGAFSARMFALKRGVTILLKGNPTLVTDGGKPVLVDTGGPELASIGSGDVLAGMIGALWARGLDRTSAAISGAYWHGVAAADLARTGTVIAPRLAEHIRHYSW